MLRLCQASFLVDVFMYVLTISPNCYFLRYLCLRRLHRARIFLPLNIAVVMPSHPLQDRVYIRFLVSLHASVILIPTTDESTELEEYLVQRVVFRHEPAIVEVPEANDKQASFPSVLRSPMTNSFCAGIVYCLAT